MQLEIKAVQEKVELAQEAVRVDSTSSSLEELRLQWPSSVFQGHLPYRNGRHMEVAQMEALCQLVSHCRPSTRPYIADEDGARE